MCYETILKFEFEICLIFIFKRQNKFYFNYFNKRLFKYYYPIHFSMKLFYLNKSIHE